MEIFRTKVVEKIKTHFMFNNLFPHPLESRSVYEIMWKNNVEPDTPHDNVIRRMRFTYRITKLRGTHSQYVMLIAFPLQQWLHERASVLRYSALSVLILLQKKKK